MKKIFFISSVILLAVLFYIFYSINNVDLAKKRIRELESDARVTSLLGEIKSLTDKGYDKNTAIEYYLTSGFFWKSIGDITIDNRDYNLAISAYKEAIKYANNTNIVPLNNLGNIYELLGDYNLAEEQYLSALKISPVEYITHKQLVDLYFYKLKKDKKEVIDLLDKAITYAVDKAPLLQLKGWYLRNMGFKNEALEVYLLLVKDHPQFQAVIDELKTEIK